MSTFQVTEILSKRVELIGILGKNKIKHLDHASVKLIDLDFLDRSSTGRGGSIGSTIPQYFIVSHDGTLLGEVGVKPHANWFAKMIWNLCYSTESVYEAVLRVGIERVAYVAVFVPGCSEGTCACELIIRKPQGNIPLQEYIRALVGRSVVSV